MGDGGVDELIWRESYGQAHLEIIFGEGWSRVGVVGRVAAQGEDAQGAADLRAAEGSGFGIGERAQFAGASFDDVAGELAGERRGFGAGALRIGKNVEVGERARRNEVEGCGVVGFGFSREASDDVGADGGVGQTVVDEFDAAGVVFGAIPAMHGGEDAVGSGLQRHVKMRSDAMVGGEEVDEILRDVERFDGADAQALDGRFVEDAAQQIEKLNARREVAAVGAEIDAAENDFAESGIGEALDFGEDGLRREAAGFSADEWDYAERAAGVAAVLDFQGGAGVIPFPAENGGDEDVGELEDVAGEDRRRVNWESVARRIERAERAPPLQIEFSETERWNGGVWGFGVCGNCRRRRKRRGERRFLRVRAGHSSRLRGCAWRDWRRGFCGWRREPGRRPRR